MRKTSGKTGTRRAPRGGAAGRGPTRRAFIQGVGAAAGAAAVVRPLSGRAAPAAAPRPSRAADGKTLGPAAVPLVLHVDGKERRLSVEPRVTLLRALRHHLGVTGPKEVCDRGACGACSVLVDGRLVNACMMLATDAAGATIVTTEGLLVDGKPHPLHEAFVAHDALQCGFCTPGMVMACKAILDAHPEPTLVQIKTGLAGNLCRCGTYPRIFAAVQTAAAAVRKAGGSKDKGARSEPRQTPRDPGPRLATRADLDRRRRPARGAAS